MIIEVFPPGIKGFVLSIQALIIQGVSLNYHMYLEGFGVGGHYELTGRMIRNLKMPKKLRQGAQN